MPSDDEIPDEMQRILERIASRINETDKLDARVAIQPDWWSPRIFRAIEIGLHRFEEIQAELGIARNILTDRLGTMVGLEILLKKQYSERPRRFEYFINHDGEGTAGQPAIVSA
jgi:DNA-binding HxlR family transcriptional regulator